MQASVARCLRTPPSSATLKGFKSVFQTALRGLSHRSIVVVGNYRFDPITAVSCRAKDLPLRPRRSCFAPAATQMQEIRMVWARVEAPGTAPGSGWFITKPVYRHSLLAKAI